MHISDIMHAELGITINHKMTIRAVSSNISSNELKLSPDNLYDLEQMHVGNPECTTTPLFRNKHTVIQ
jgi:hypothetical protein